ncbi:MAG: hypothetical protein Q9164_005900 [Protoblastenia rupestris]
MVREDLVTSAVTFLQDPSVAASDLDKRIAFLQSKNLTKVEVDLALARAGDGSQQQNTVASPSSPDQYASPSQHALRQPAGYGSGYGPYHNGYWGQPPPPPPRRDWRDWFIMATVTAGVGYGLYTAAQRYIFPLIAPPTPPQLEQDKAAIDESFNKAFALIDQLAADTATLKASEAERTEKLDTTLKDVDTVVADLKAANSRREAESRIIADQVQGLKDLVPKALEGWKANGDARLDDLSQEMQSLKRLLENRVGRSAGTPTPKAKGNLPASVNGVDKLRNDEPDIRSSDGSSMSSVEAFNGTPAPAPAPGITVPKTDFSSSKRVTPGNDRKAAIPAWQMAAASKSADGDTAEAGA